MRSTDSRDFKPVRNMRGILKSSEVDKSADYKEEINQWIIKRCTTNG